MEKQKSPKHYRSQETLLDTGPKNSVIQTFIRVLMVEEGLKFGFIILTLN
jgi:hypothetical protein